MIYVALFIQAAEALLLEKEIRDEAAFRTNEQVVIKRIADKKEYDKFLEHKEIIDFIYIDVAMRDGIQMAECLRESFPSTNIIVIANLEMSPVQYLKPSIMAAALLLRPLQKAALQQTIHQLFEHFVNKVDEEKVFLIETRDEKQRIPYTDILYFEAREKKIYACTYGCEYGFYDTIEHLEECLPEGFIRTHRSYIVNQEYVEKVFISKSYLLLEHQIEIPLSRSYKGVIKDNVGKK